MKGHEDEQTPNNSSRGLFRKITIRLKAVGAFKLSAAHIKSFADQDVHVASTIVTDSLPYEVFTGIISS